MFIFDREFDLGMIYFIRNATRNLPIEVASVVEDNPKAKSLDDYITKILMMESEDAQGFLLNVVPIVLRINIFIVNIDTSANARVPYFLILIDKWCYLKVQYPRM